MPCINWVEAERTAYALAILPALMQLVQTRIRFGAPFTRALTACRFTFHRRRVTLCACEMLLPNCGPLPQMSHTCAIVPLRNSLVFRAASAVPSAFSAAPIASSAGTAGTRKSASPVGLPNSQYIVNRRSSQTRHLLQAGQSGLDWGTWHVEDIPSRTPTHATKVCPPTSFVQCLSDVTPA